MPDLRLWAVYKHKGVQPICSSDSDSNTIIWENPESTIIAICKSEANASQIAFDMSQAKSRHSDISYNYAVLNISKQAIDMLADVVLAKIKARIAGIVDAKECESDF